MNRNKETGAVLVVSLILLLVITLVGINNLGTTSLEEKMAENMQVGQIVFQASESAIEVGLEDTDFLWDAYVASPNTETQAVSNSTATFSRSEVEAEFIQETVPKGDSATSIVEGKSAYQHYHYYIYGHADLDNSYASSTHAQGVYLKGASTGSDSTSGNLDL